jgi:hypothetical protein
MVGLFPSAVMSSSDALDLVGLSPLMARTSGRREISIGLIDGPLAVDHPELPPENIHVLPGQVTSACVDDSSTACAHGTFIAGVLLAKRGSVAPAICPGCTLLVCPIFTEAIPDGEIIPGATADALAEALVAVMDAGARIVVVVIAAAGNQRAVSSLMRAPPRYGPRSPQRAGGPPSYRLC